MVDRTGQQRATAGVDPAVAAERLGTPSAQNVARNAGDASSVQACDTKEGAGAPSLPELRRTAELFAPKDGELVEVFALGDNSSLGHGFFDAKELVDGIDEFQKLDCKGLYLRPNPITDNGEWHPRGHLDGGGTYAKSANIASRRWGLIDIDPDRSTDTASNDAELEDARALAGKVRNLLTEEGFPPPATACSGNGVHLLYPLANISTEGDKEDPYRLLIDGLAEKFKGVGLPNGSAVKIDKAPKDSGRAVRFYGSVNRKGDNSSARPWRRSKIETVPEDIVPVTREQLEVVVAKLPKAGKGATGPKAKADNKSSSSSKSTNKTSQNPPEEIVQDALAYLDPSCEYAVWLEVGMGLHSWDQEHGLGIWENWSKGPDDSPCAKFEEGECREKWRSFDAEKSAAVSMGSLFHHAKEAGWNGKAAWSRYNGRQHRARPSDALMPGDLAEEFIDRKRDNGGNVLFHRWAGRWYGYDGGLYKLLSDEDFASTVMRFLRAKESQPSVKAKGGVLARTRTLNDVLANIKSSENILVPSSKNPPLWVTENGFEDASGWVALEGAHVNIWRCAELMAGLEQWQDTDVAREPAPELFAVQGFPHSYQPEAKCPRWAKFLRQAQPDEEGRRVVQMMFGLALVPCTDFQVLPYVCGPRGTGKSLVLDVIAALVGEQNVCVVSPKEMGGSFDQAVLSKRLLNICDDLFCDDDPAATRASEGFLKAMVAGARVSGQVKHVDRTVTADKKVTARTIAAGNQLPSFRDKSGALADRLRIIPFRRIFRGTEDQVIGLADQIIAEEMDGVFIWALHGLAMLLKHGQFPEHPEGEKMKVDAMILTDSAARYIRKKLENPASDDRALAAAQLYADYTHWCDAEGLQPVSKKQFAEKMYYEKGAVKKRMRATDGSQPWVFEFPRTN